VLYYVNCDIAFNFFSTGDLVLVKVQISDLGYARNGAIREGARIAEVLWVVQIAPEQIF
jgi:hypothetical protein